MLLVQFLLRTIFDTTSLFRDRNPFVYRDRSGNVRPLAIDGRFGTQTSEAVLHFQKVMKQQGQGISVIDGRVDPPRNEHVAGSLSQAQYTILNLNLGVAKGVAAAWPNISSIHLCPAELRTLLQHPTFVGHSSQ